MGLPEVNLGLIPGAGGTVRLPRLVSADVALEMVAGGKPVGAARALQIGLIDAVAEGDLRAFAVQFAVSKQDDPTPRGLAQRPVQAAPDEAAAKFGNARKAKILPSRRLTPSSPV